MVMGSERDQTAADLRRGGQLGSPRSMVQIVKAPSILGLRPTGVELMADALLRDGLDTHITPRSPLLVVEDLNAKYSTERTSSGVLNAQPLRIFSERLKDEVITVVQHERLPVVLGGDCSILLGAMLAMKTLGTYGLVTLDAHSDFYLPSQSPTGKAADMDVALVTGRGPEILTDIDGLRPYVDDAHVVHVGQRDEAETIQYGASQISQTAIVRHDLEAVRHMGIEAVTSAVLATAERVDVEGFWLHVDTDVVHDEENPAVDYRLPGGLRLSECEFLLGALAASGLIRGLSVAIYNPRLDAGGIVGRRMSEMLLRVISRVDTV